MAWIDDTNSKQTDTHEEEDDMSTLNQWMVWKDDTNTEEEDDMYNLYPRMVWKDDSNTGDEEEDNINVYSVSVNGLKRQYEHRETKRTEGVTHTNSLTTNTLI